MQRKTKKDNLKENALLLTGPICVILFGIFCAIAPHVIPGKGYDSLQTKEVTIVAFERHHAGRYSPDYDYILTTDGDQYNITGNYQREQLEERLTSGKSVTIKWRKNKSFWTLFAEEIYVDGERLVTYNNDEPVDWKSALIIGACFIVPGAGWFFLMDSMITENAEKKKKRNGRSRRKRKRKG